MRKQGIIITAAGLVLILSAAVSALGVKARTEPVALVNKVNPMVGTDGHGHTYPGAALPFGMVQLSPDTGTDGWDWCSGYHYSDHSIMGFSHTHLSGTGCADLGDFLFMPTTGDVKLTAGSKRDPDAGFRSRFSHDREKAEPGFYAVYLQDYDIDAELTVTPRVGVHRYRYPATAQANVIIDLTHAIGGARIVESKVAIVGDRQIRGFVRKNGWSPNRYLYFAAEFSKPFTESGIRADGKLDTSAKQGQGRDLQCFVRFDTTTDREVLAKVALSAVSWDGAAANLKAECPGWDFDQVRQAASDTWEKQLAKFTVKGSPVNERVFYTALYHSCLAPNLFVDIDGQYRGTDKKIHRADNFTNYTVFSLWDTFRAAHPLFTLIEQERTNDFIKSMLGKYDQQGHLPYWELASGETWCMIGYHAVPVIADAWVKGIRGYDGSRALEAMKKSAMQDHQGLSDYKTLGYISMDNGGQSVSRTMEYAYDDWCIAAMAGDLGQKADYEHFSLRSQYYRNLFDASVGFVRARNADGVWKPDFNPDDLPVDGASEFTEGNSWHFTYFAPHDITGLIGLMGGDGGFIGRLDDLFTKSGKEHADVSGLIGQYAQGNEPCHNFAYLYAYAGAPWKTQERVSQIVTTLFTDQPDGICGNEDCGQMSAWYVFSAMGFYPVCPARPVYVFGTPLFDEVTINLENGKTFRVAAENRSEANIYIQSAKLNGRPYSRTYIEHADIVNGGKLVFVMGPQPNKQYGSAQADRPVSAADKELTLMPYMAGKDTAFTDVLTVDLRCDDKGAQIRYTLDGTEPDASGTLYTQPFKVTDSTTLRARAFRAGAMPSMPLTASLERKTPIAAAAVSDDQLENGLNYEVFYGSFRSTRDLLGKKAQKQGVCKGFDLSVSDRRDDFGVAFTGWYKAPAAGMYQFWTSSDDGSRLYIDSQLVVNNDGPHGARFVRGVAALEPGYHEIRVEFFEGSVTEELDVHVAAPGADRKPVPAASLYRKK